MQNIVKNFLVLLMCLILAACKGTPETPPLEVQKIQLGDLQLNIVQDPQQVRMPAISQGTVPPRGPGEVAGKHYAYTIYTEKTSVDLSQLPQVQNAASLQEVSNLLKGIHLSSYVVLYLTNTEGGLPEEDGTFSTFSTTAANVYVLVDQQEMASSAKLARMTNKVFEFSYVEVIGDVAVDFVEESLYDAISWMRVEKLQTDLLRDGGTCEPGIHWSCATFHIVDENGKGIPGATVRLELGSMVTDRWTDEAGYVTIPLNSARNKPSSGDLRKFHEFTFRAFAEGYGTWDGKLCKIFSAPYEANTYTVVLPRSGDVYCSAMTESESQQENPAPQISRIVPPGFYMKGKEYIEKWEWKTLRASCVIESEYTLKEMVDERTAILNYAESVYETRAGDCSAVVSAPEQIKVDVITGARVDSPEPSLRFAGAESRPEGASPSLFDNVSVWQKTSHQEIPWENNQVYYYDLEHYLDQFTGIRIYRVTNGWRTVQGAKDEGYCRWQQTLSVETNAPIGGNPAGYSGDYPLGKSGCAGLEAAQEVPAGDPCIVVRNFYDWMNAENLDLFFQNFLTEGWSQSAFQAEYDWQKNYFNEYDVRYTVNSCNVTWKAFAPPFSAILTSKVHSVSDYRGNHSESDLDVTMYAVYRNGDWYAVRGFSVEDSTAVTVPFINSTNGVVEVYWIDYEKNERKWFELQPGEKRDIGTAVTHVWMVYDQASGERLAFVVIFPNQQPIVISKP